MINMVIFTTDRSEDELFLRFASRGRSRADVPYYYSVEEVDVKRGMIVFCRLDCAPSQPYKVGFAGNEVITSASFADNVSEFLGDWDIPFTKTVKEYSSALTARRLLSYKRETKVGKEERSRVNLRIKQGLRELREKETQELQDL